MISRRFVKNLQVAARTAGMCRVRPTNSDLFQVFCGCVAIATIATVIVIGEDSRNQSGVRAVYFAASVLAPGSTGIYMSQMTRLASTGCVVLTLCGALFGCSARTYVSGTGSTPSQFTHVFITTQEVWFNTSSSATADDSGWSKFPLTTPVTIDLVQESNGTLGQIAGDLRLAPGTYSSILLMPLDNTAAAVASALALGAANNLEADYTDSSGTSHQVQLVIPNPEKGIIVTGTSLKVPVGGASLGAVGTTSSTSSTTSSTTGTSTSSTNKTVTVSFASNFDANRDLHLFNYPLGTTTSQSVLMGPTPVATDLSTTGGISGTLTLTNLTNNTNITSASGRVAIQASAELVSADLSHHVIVASAPVQTDGTFTIYPLQSNSKTPTVYDVVIHGPGIETIIIKSVSVATTTPTLAAAANTTGAVATTTASGAVSLGTFIPIAVPSYYVSATPATGTLLPAGAAVTFYQTLPGGSSEMPYAIDEVGIDPFNQNLQTPEQLAMGSIESGVYASSGSTITVTAALPAQGSGTYWVGATAPLFSDAAISSGNLAAPPTTTTTPTAGTAVNTTTTAVAATVPSPSPVTSAGSIAVAVTTTSNQYDSGELLVSHNGAVIGSVSLAGALGGSGGNVTIPNIPSSQGNYYLSAILWSSGNPGTLVYQSITSPVTVSAGTNAASVTLE
jgi:Domain of unknown function (DUF4382)